MQVARPVPVWAIAASFAIGVAILSLMISLFDWSRNPALFGYSWLLSSWLELIAALMPVMLLAGVPPGLLRLRSPDTGIGRWGGTGMLAMLAGAIVFYTAVALRHGVDALLVPEGFGVALFCVPVGFAIGALAWLASRLIARAAR